MELIKEIYFENDVKCNNYKIRKAARSIAFNTDGKIPLLNVSKNNYHKLAGANIGELEEIGVIIEYRNKFELLQFSYYYKSKVIGKLTETAFTEKEKNNGFILEWKTLDEAIELLKNDKPIDYEGQFIVKRDLEFLEYFKKFYI